MSLTGSPVLSAIACSQQLREKTDRAFANWASGAAMHRKITRQSRWNLRRASDRAIPNQAPETGEGVETGWRAPLVGEGTVRLSSKGESDRITQRSAVQIRPPQP